MGEQFVHTNGMNVDHEHLTRKVFVATCSTPMRIAVAQNAVVSTKEKFAPSKKIQTSLSSSSFHKATATTTPSKIGMTIPAHGMKRTIIVLKASLKKNSSTSMLLMLAVLVVGDILFKKKETSSTFLI